MFLFYTFLGGVLILGLFGSVLLDSAPLSVLCALGLVFTFLRAFAEFDDSDDEDGGTAA